MFDYKFTRELPIMDTGTFDLFIRQTFGKDGVTGTSGTCPDGVWNITVHSDTELSKEIIDLLGERIANQEEFEVATPNEPTFEDDISSMLVDHEYRLVLLELGVI